MKKKNWKKPISLKSVFPKENNGKVVYTFLPPQYPADYSEMSVLAEKDCAALLSFTGISLLI